MKGGLALLLCISGFFWALGAHAEDGCLKCHGDASQMQALGHPHFAITSDEVKTQSGMTGAGCTSCHLGNSGAATAGEAHRGMLTLKAVTPGWKVFTRAEMTDADLKDWAYLEPRGAKRSTQLGPKVSVKDSLRDNPKFKLIMYHDKNPDTLAFNPKVAEKTCGVCHKGIVQSFLTSPMGGGKGAHTQSQYLSWTGPAGPQSCGVWVGSLAAPQQDRFTDANMKYFNRHSTTPLTEQVAYDVQRTCNQCHVGCLDCHLNPQKKDANDPRAGAHRFVGKPEPLACYGGGRSFSCHAGPLERRRGDGYIRADFTQASSKGKETLAPAVDAHMQKGLACVECHEPNRKTGDHADLQRNVNCAKCHSAVVGSHKRGPHRKVDCAACHTALIGGYAFNFWTLTEDERGKNPITRLQGYLTDAVPPLLVRKKGVWIPVHVVPHTSGNVKASEVKFSTRLMSRNRPDSAIDRRYVSSDYYAVTGLVKELDDADHDTLLWLNIDRVAHGTGKSRTCESCHGSRAQEIIVGFEASGETYKDVEDGQYTIIADDKGLRVTDFKGPDGGPMAKGLEPFQDKWSLKGNFALPRIKHTQRYEKLRKAYRDGVFSH
jgi:hypothetical protein